MKQVVLVGAGGKMGCRLTDNLKDHPNYHTTYLEVSEAGLQRMEERGVKASVPQEVIPMADIIILAVPDVAIKAVSATYTPMARSGAMVVTLDPAAPLAGHLYPRDDISYFATHPSHPSVFNWEPDEQEHFDYFGGIAARQSIVCALIQGSEADYQDGEALAKVIYAPVVRAHRITIEQMGLLEPALSETFGAAVVSVMKEAVDQVVGQGVPKAAAYDFFLGHINIELALLFNQLPGGQFSDAALKAIEIGKPLIFKENWKDIFKPENVQAQIEAIT